MENTLLASIKSLLNVEAVAAPEAGFLGTKFNYKGYNWTVCMDNYKVNLRVEGSTKGVNRLSWNNFQVAKKDATNKKHVEYIESYMNALLAVSKMPAMCQLSERKFLLLLTYNR